LWYGWLLFAAAARAASAAGLVKLLSLGYAVTSESVPVDDLGLKPAVHHVQFRFDHANLTCRTKGESYKRENLDDGSQVDFGVEFHQSDSREDGDCPAHINESAGEREKSEQVQQNPIDLLDPLAK
jgi:hypothetical protein